MVARVADEYDVPLAHGAGNTYSAGFDTRVLVDMLYPSLEVSANDRAGNASTVGLAFALDNAPPTVALESPQMRMWELDADRNPVCSRPFNPLGAAAAKTGLVVQPAAIFGVLFYPRARIEDHGNDTDTGMSVIPIAGVDPNTTKLYALSSAGLGLGRRLLISDANGRCVINPLVEPDPVDPLPEQAVVQTLVPVPPSGMPDFRSGGAVAGSCGEGTATNPPLPVCDAPVVADISYWLSYTAAVSPAIYVLNLYGSDILACGGGAFDGRNLPDGPACLAAVATDMLGNHAASTPLAICINTTGGAACAGFNPATVVCSDGCTTTAFRPNEIRKHGG